MLKVGLVGWGASTGNGGMNYDIARIAPWVTSWLCPKHPSFGWHEAYLEEVSDKVIKCEREGDIKIYEQFLDRINVVLFIEHPYLRGYELVNECQKRGILTACIPMWEWFPEQKSWSKNLDMVWCVTKYTRQYMQTLAHYLKHRHDCCNWSNKIYGDRWGIELEKFEFTSRNKANRFLFINGNGGGGALRKGSETIAQMATYVPDMEIIMVTQGDNYTKPMPSNVKIIECNFSHKKEIYQYGDILVAPTHWEGFGHTLYEAQACGLPVITINAAPMNECGAEWFIPISHFEQYELSGKPIPKVFAKPKKLANLLLEIKETDISQKSIKARHHVEKHHNLKDVIDDLKEAIKQGINFGSHQSNFIYTAELKTFIDSNDQYKTLVEQAWIEYTKKNLDEMSNLLQQSFKHKPLLRTEIILDWIDTFNRLSSKSSHDFKIETLTNSNEWNKLMSSVINAENV